MNCIFDSLEKGTACIACGYELRKDFSQTPKRRCGSPNAVKPGTTLEELLASYGFTKEWLTRIKEEHGFPPTCDCDARKKWLDDLAAAHPTIASIGVKLLDALKRKT